MYRKKMFEVLKGKTKMYTIVEKLQFGTDEKERLLHLMEINCSSTLKGKVCQTVLRTSFVACSPKMTGST